MTVKLVVVGTGEEPLPPSLSSNKTALITEFNHVTLTCPKQTDPNGNPVDCNDFDVSPSVSDGQDFEHLTFDFKFTPKNPAASMWS